MSAAPLKAGPVQDGQRYVDDPVYKVIGKVRPELDTELAHSIAQIFKTRPPQRIEDLVGYNRTRLRWMKPDGKGGLVPR